LTQLSTELFDVLDGKAHSPSQTSEQFGQAHLVEVSSVKYYYAEKSSIKPSSKHGHQPKSPRMPRSHAFNNLWIHILFDGQKRHKRALETSAISKLGSRFPKMYVTILDSSQRCVSLLI
jgi:hypothetical protein